MGNEVAEMVALNRDYREALEKTNEPIDLHVANQVRKNAERFTLARDAALAKTHLESMRAEYAHRARNYTEEERAREEARLRKFLNQRGEPPAKNATVDEMQIAERGILGDDQISTVKGQYHLAEGKRKELDGAHKSLLNAVNGNSKEAQQRAGEALLRNSVAMGSLPNAGEFYKSLNLYLHPNLATDKATAAEYKSVEAKSPEQIQQWLSKRWHFWGKSGPERAAEWYQGYQDVIAAEAGKDIKENVPVMSALAKLSTLNAEVAALMMPVNKALANPEWARPHRAGGKSGHKDILNEMGMNEKFEPYGPDGNTGTWGSRDAGEQGAFNRAQEKYENVGPGAAPGGPVLDPNLPSEIAKAKAAAGGAPGAGAGAGVPVPNTGGASGSVVPVNNAILPRAGRAVEPVAAKVSSTIGDWARERTNQAMSEVKDAYHTWIDDRNAAGSDPVVHHGALPMRPSARTPEGIPIPPQEEVYETNPHVMSPMLHPPPAPPPPAVAGQPVMRPMPMAGASMAQPLSPVGPPVAQPLPLEGSQSRAPQPNAMDHQRGMAQIEQWTGLKGMQQITELKKYYMQTTGQSQAMLDKTLKAAFANDQRAINMIKAVSEQFKQRTNPMAPPVAQSLNLQPLEGPMEPAPWRRPPLPTAQ